MTFELDRKPSLNELAKRLDCGKETARKSINKFGLDDMLLNNVSSSKYEEEINELFPCARRNDRKLLSGKEIDFYYEDEKLAIEFNGSYWHNDTVVNKKYHIDKTKLCNKLGVRLIHVFEYEWIDQVKKDIITSLIGSALGKESIQSIYARDTEVKEIGSEIAVEFLDKYHLQGKSASSVQIGLYSGNELVGVMTFGKPRFNNEYAWELIRLAYKNNVRVVVGTEKMLKYFVRKNNPTNILSYCNLSKFSGQVYERIGFKFIGNTEPSYVWYNVNNHIVLSRYQTMRSKLQSKFDLDEYYDSMTEDEIMESLDYVKIYDCGNAKYEWTRKE
jgi:very-short-patch-repair endonuclease